MAKEKETERTMWGQRVRLTKGQALTFYQAAYIRGVGEAFTISQTAFVLGLSERAVRRMVHAGELPGLKVEGRLAVIRGDVEEYRLGRHLPPPLDAEA